MRLLLTVRYFESLEGGPRHPPQKKSGHEIDKITSDIVK